MIIQFIIHAKPTPLRSSQHYSRIHPADSSEHRALVGRRACPPPWQPSLGGGGPLGSEATAGRLRLACRKVNNAALVKKCQAAGQSRWGRRTIWRDEPLIRATGKERNDGPPTASSASAEVRKCAMSCKSTYTLQSLPAAPTRRWTAVSAR